MTTHANSEAVARAWLKTVTGLPVNQIGTTLPQRNKDQVFAWADTGFVQIQVIGGSPNKYYGYRKPVILAHCWASNPDKQTPPWGMANHLAECIVAGCEAENSKQVLNLGITGMANAKVTQAWILEEPRRIPWGFPSGQGSFIDPANTAHYTVSFQMAWAELP